MGTRGIEGKALAQGHTAVKWWRRDKSRAFWLKSWHIYSTSPIPIMGEVNAVISFFLWSILSGSMVTGSTYHNAYWEHTSMKQFIVCLFCFKVRELLYFNIYPRCSFILFYQALSPSFWNCVSSAHLSEDTHGIPFINLDYLIHNVAPPQQIYTHLWEG